MIAPEWLPSFVTFLAVTVASFGMYLLFRRNPVVPVAVPDDDPEPVPDEAITASRLQPKMLELRKELRSAGVYEPQALAEYTAFRAVAALAVLACTALVMFLSQEEMAGQIFLIGVLLAILAYSVPRVALLAWRRRQTRLIERDLPLAIDLQVLCLSAGQGLIAALRQTATQLRRQSPVLARELAIVCKHAELRSLEHALIQWSDRVHSAEVRNLSLLLVQSERLGTNSAETLHELANSYRTNSRQRAEAQANRTSFWMLFPSVFCFWVAAAIILIGPTYVEFFRNRQGASPTNAQPGQVIQSISNASANSRGATEIKSVAGANSQSR